MNRNVESHFSRLPQANIQRSVFDRSSSHKFSFNAGEIIPFYVDEVLPGDTFDITTSKIVRSQTMLTPIMDNMYLDTYWFFIPNRLVWSHWEEFCGENKTGPWTQKVEYTVPSLGCPNGALFESGTLADYMGLPIQSYWKADSKLAPSVLPFRAYSLVINEFFRDQNFANPLLVPLDDANVTGTNNSPIGASADLSACSSGGKPYVANRYHDYFSSALPAAQKGTAVSIGLPVKGNVTTLQKFNESLAYPVVFMRSDCTIGDLNNKKLYGLKTTTDSKYHSITPAQGQMSDVGNSTGVVNPQPLSGFYPVNLGFEAEPSFSINDFRLAYVYQSYLEAIARSGSRYGEMLQSIFGVTNPDSRLQHPEYLGGNRIPINVSEVTNTSQAEKDFLGDVGAKSVTSDVNHDFIKSFTEHGILLGLCVVRYDHSYSQGLERWWTRKKFLDFYNPMFANLGETPIYKAEIYAGPGDPAHYDSNSPINQPDKTFGFQECWADYRYKPNRVSGAMRPGVQKSLAYWHLGDYYDKEPTLSESWLFESKSNVDRCLAVTSAVADQFWADIYIRNRCTRAMPMYSVPGLEPKF